MACGSLRFTVVRGTDGGTAVSDKRKAVVLRVIMFLSDCFKKSKRFLFVFRMTGLADEARLFLGHLKRPACPDRPV